MTDKDTVQTLWNLQQTLQHVFDKSPVLLVPFSPDVTAHEISHLQYRFVLIACFLALVRMCNMQQALLPRQLCLPSGRTSQNSRLSLMRLSTAG